MCCPSIGAARWEALRWQSSWPARNLAMTHCCSSWGTLASCPSSLPLLSGVLTSAQIQQCLNDTLPVGSCFHTAVRLFTWAISCCTQACTSWLSCRNLQSDGSLPCWFVWMLCWKNLALNPYRSGQHPLCLAKVGTLRNSLFNGGLKGAH